MAMEDLSLHQLKIQEHQQMVQTIKKSRNGTTTPTNGTDHKRKEEMQEVSSFLAIYLLYVQKKL